MSANKDEPNKPAAASSPPPKPPAAKPPATATAAAAKQPAPAAAKPTAAGATPPKKEPEAPPFEKGLVEEIKKKFGESIIKVVFIKPFRIKIQVEPSNIVEVATFLRDNMGFDHAESVAGTDYPKDNQIEVIYHLGSYTREDLGAHILSLTTRTSRDDARLPTLINVYKSVEYHERETFEMLGVYFEGHPRNDRFLLPEDWADIPPLRKDFRIKGR
ncbi:NADH-quinone oxidoreductase subunit C [Candidatus Nitrososphaera gargensis Ga9.2]|uniref:NADH-quinone oxidoreductase subunit C n=1 Tax=Nitrososphaera gargensis (strain Ga9.2) TaxID=1237085 RepID=K0IMQ2_NITGG|nr:NADH-quinone oxidoreductase subunit C [Candidatus Nitrososphaera gargensis]AFU58094.1 NADH-quinone oxidoreductase subunit C [Candidatus Nitrososphaera gargensis Ga9.2]